MKYFNHRDQSEIMDMCSHLFIQGNLASKIFFEKVGVFGKCYDKNPCLKTKIFRYLLE